MFAPKPGYDPGFQTCYNQAVDTPFHQHDLPLVWSGPGTADALEQVDRHVVALKLQRWVLRAMLSLKKIDPEASVCMSFDGSCDENFCEAARFQVGVNGSTFKNSGFKEMPGPVSAWFSDLIDGWPEERRAYDIAQAAFGQEGWMTIADWAKRLPHTLPDPLLAQYRQQQLAQQWEGQPVSSSRPRPRA